MKIRHIIGYKKDLGRGYSLLGRASIDFIVIDVITHPENYDEDYVTMTKRSAERDERSSQRCEGGLGAGRESAKAISVTE